MNGFSTITRTRDRRARKRCDLYTLSRKGRGEVTKDKGKIKEKKSLWWKRKGEEVKRGREWKRQLPELGSRISLCSRNKSRYIFVRTKQFTFINDHLCSQQLPLEHVRRSIMPSMHSRTPGPHRGCLPNLPWTIYVVGKSRFEIALICEGLAFSIAQWVTQSSPPTTSNIGRRWLSMYTEFREARLSHREETSTHTYTQCLSGTSARLWDDYC